MGWELLDLSGIRKADMRPLTGEARFYADHNLDQSIVYVLRHEKFDVETAEGIQADKQPDEFHYRYAFKSKRVLLTHDKDFLDNERYPLSQTCGVIVFNVDTNNASQIARVLEVVVTILAGLAPALRQKKFVVNSDYTIRMTERVPSNAGWQEQTRRFRFDTNVEDVWIWEEEAGEARGGV